MIWLRFLCFEDSSGFEFLKFLIELLFGRWEESELVVMRVRVQVLKFMLVAFKTVYKNVNIKMIICKGTLQFVPSNKRDEIYIELHCSPIGGHRGVSKTYNRIKQNYYWENLKGDI